MCCSNACRGKQIKVLHPEILSQSECISLSTLMLVTDITDEICRLQYWGVGVRLSCFCHQYPNLIIRIAKQYHKNATKRQTRFPTSCSQHQYSRPKKYALKKYRANQLKQLRFA